MASNHIEHLDLVEVITPFGMRQLLDTLIVWETKAISSALPAPPVYSDAASLGPHCSGRYSHKSKAPQLQVAWGRVLEEFLQLPAYGAGAYYCVNRGCIVSFDGSATCAASLPTLNAMADAGILEHQVTEFGESGYHTFFVQTPVRILAPTLRRSYPGPP